MSKYATTQTCYHYNIPCTPHLRHVFVNPGYDSAYMVNDRQSSCLARYTLYLATSEDDAANTIERLRKQEVFISGKAGFCREAMHLVLGRVQEHNKGKR